MASSRDERPPTVTEVDAVRAIARLGRAAERALGDLSLAHYRVLSAIGSGDERASRVAMKFSLGKPAVSAIVDALCRNGLVMRSAADDQRVSALRLTGEGEQVLERAEQGLVSMLRELASRDPAVQPISTVLAATGVALEDDARERNVRTTPRTAGAGAGAGTGSGERA